MVPSQVDSVEISECGFGEIESSIKDIARSPHLWSAPLN